MKKTFRVEIINSYQASMFILTHRTLQQVISIIEGFEGEELTFNIQDQKTLKKHDIVLQDNHVGNPRVLISINC